MSAPRVSVLMPVRDGGWWLLEAVASLRAQTVREWELILVDDHSSDGAIAALPGDRRIRVVANARCGIVGALNTGLAHCSAPFVARLDADDRMRPDRLERQLDCFAADPTLTVVASRVRAFAGAEPVPDGMRRYLAWQNRLLDHRSLVANAFVEAPVTHPSVTLRTDALRALGGYRVTSWAEDFDLWLRARAAGWRFHKLMAPLTGWRDHSLRLTRTDARCNRDQYIAARAYHLVESELSGRAVAICGGGKHATGLCRALRARGATVSHFYDIAPWRIGGRRQGIPVLPLSSIASQPPDTLTLGCVARPASRRALRDALQQLGRTEGTDFLMTA
ncbi:MAG: glycosyltransferase [Pseudomonadota bacterium]